MKNILITVLVIIVLCLSGYIVYDKIIANENNEKDIVENKIEITSELEQELRKKIPTISYCNQYLWKQYRSTKFYATEITEEDKTSNFNECQGSLAVFNLPNKIESTVNEVYIYDYILLYNMQGTMDNKYYGPSLDNIYIDYDAIAIDTSNGKLNILESSMKQYGKLYKYTFKFENGMYSYVSTEPIN